MIMSMLHKLSSSDPPPTPPPSPPPLQTPNPSTTQITGGEGGGVGVGGEGGEFAQEKQLRVDIGAMRVTVVNGVYICLRIHITIMYR